MKISLEKTTPRAKAVVQEMPHLTSRVTYRQLRASMIMYVLNLKSFDNNVLKHRLFSKDHLKLKNLTVASSKTAKTLTFLAQWSTMALPKSSNKKSQKRKK